MYCINYIINYHIVFATLHFPDLLFYKVGPQGLQHLIEIPQVVVSLRQ